VSADQLRLLPPLVIATEDVDSALAILRDVLA
jgi:4-aminobutyrate aminotransferase-like enzyme